MRKDLAERWADALESGDYEQARGYLNTPGGMCCLGVLCDLYREEHQDGGWDPPGKDGAWGPGATVFTVIGPDGEEERESRILPRRVRAWAEMRCSDGSFGPRPRTGEVRSLASANDCGYSFSTIAEMIRQRKDEL